MFKKFLTVLAFVGASALATGCVVEASDVSDICVDDDECPLNSFCDDLGDCVEGCLDDYNCEAGAICDFDLGLCVI